MPQFYVTEKESVLDAAMKQYMLENNIAYYEYPFDFDQCFLTLNPNILSNSFISCVFILLFSDI